ncbi:MAG TPA: hypothetical protein VNT51_04020 [Miltoncostaeaceae bacterium]|nr:hypothetical protein [Miltoncostaeaceae bacterium]
MLAHGAVASPQDVLDDYADNGVIDRCYSDAEFEGALDLIRPDQEQYGAARDVIETRQAECATASADGGEAAPEDEDDDDGVLLWIVLGVIAVALIGGGAAAAARRRGGGR